MTLDVRKRRAIGLLWFPFISYTTQSFVISLERFTQQSLLGGLCTEGCAVGVHMTSHHFPR